MTEEGDRRGKRKNVECRRKGEQNINGRRGMREQGVKGVGRRSEKEEGKNVFYVHPSK